MALQRSTGAPAVRISAFEIPTDAPEADGTLEWSSTTLVTVEVSAGGITGLGYTYADMAAADFVRTHLARILARVDPMDTGAVFAAMERAARNAGREGVGAMAISAVDVACWDLRARSLGVPLVDLLGARKDHVAVYASGGFTSYGVDELVRRLAAAVEAGHTRVKMKIGDAPDTMARVRAVRAAIGPQVQLFVDANGAFDRRGAVAMAEELARCDVTWFEEPVSSDDLEGLRFVHDRAPAAMAVAAGEYGYRSSYFARMLDASAVDVLQADATRCGVTGFLQAAALCDARGVALSAHCAPTVHAQLGCAAPRVVHLEYFHDHARIEAMVFDGAPRPHDGELRPDRSRPGLGISLDRARAAPYLVFDERVGVRGAA